MIMHPRIFVDQVIIAFMPLCTGHTFHFGYSLIIRYFGVSSVFIPLVLFQKFSNIVCLLAIKCSFYMLTYFIVKLCNTDCHTLEHIPKRAVKRACESRIILYLFTQSRDEDIVYLHIYHPVLIVYL